MTVSHILMRFINGLEIGISFLPLEVTLVKNKSSLSEKVYTSLKLEDVIEV
jgi:hypothetical protein